MWASALRCSMGTWNFCTAFLVNIFSFPNLVPVKGNYLKIQLKKTRSCSQPTMSTDRNQQKVCVLDSCRHLKLNDTATKWTVLLFTQKKKKGTCTIILWWWCWICETLSSSSSIMSTGYRKLFTGFCCQIIESHLTECCYKNCVCTWCFKCPLTSWQNGKNVMWQRETALHRGRQAREKKVRERRGRETRRELCRGRGERD